MHPSEFHPDRFPRGEIQRLLLEFGTLELPMLLARGADDGPTLGITAGVHGDEYEGIRAIFDLFARLDPRTMRGEVIAIPIANGPAFWNGTRVSPLDQGNLARVFPGSPDGSPTEAIAYWLDQTLLAHSDFYIDLHSAGTGFEMPLLVGYWSEDSRAVAAAEAFGAPILWAHPTIPDGRTVSAAKARGIPFLYTEMRGAGRIHPDDLNCLHTGLDNLLRHLGMLPGLPKPSGPARRLIGDGNIDASILAELRGFLIPRVELLERVEQGRLLGEVVDTLGRTIQEIHAPTSGVVALVHAKPLVQSGEPLFLITQDAA